MSSADMVRVLRYRLDQVCNLQHVCLLWSCAQISMAVVAPSAAVTGQQCHVESFGRVLVSIPFGGNSEAVVPDAGSGRMMGGLAVGTRRNGQAPEQMRVGGLDAVQHQGEDASGCTEFVGSPPPLLLILAADCDRHGLFPTLNLHIDRYELRTVKVVLGLMRTSRQSVAVLA
jgi:hypothetical protein